MVGNEAYVFLSFNGRHMQVLWVWAWCSDPNGYQEQSLHCQWIAWGGKAARLVGQVHQKVCPLSRMWKPWNNFGKPLCINHEKWYNTNGVMQRWQSNIDGMIWPFLLLSRLCILPRPRSVKFVQHAVAIMEHWTWDTSWLPTLLIILQENLLLPVVMVERSGSIVLFSSCDYMIKQGQERQEWSVLSNMALLQNSIRLR